MRQTEYRRRKRAAQDKVAAEVQQLAQAELSRLFRQVQLKIRRVNQYRPRAGVRRPKLRKAYVISNDMWETFRRRLHSAVMRAIVFGAISLSDLSRDYFDDLKAVEFDSAEFARLIEPEIGERITRVTTSIKREVGQKVVAWYNSPGATMQSLVNQLQERFGASRAATIAQNEVTYLNSRVTENIAAQLGLQEWWWSTRQDQIVCKKPLIGPDGKRYAGCRELHGKKFKIGQKMPPDGSHIGCVLPGQVVAVPGLSIATESFYSGDIVELLTVSGRRISVTPNHPILTSKGYVPAQLINKGDQVISHSNPERVVSSVNPNYNHAPSVIEKVFSSLQMADGMQTTTVPAASVDFHGDGRGLDGNVNIVYSDRKLAIGNDSNIKKQINQLVLDWRTHCFSFISSLCLFFSLLNSAHSAAPRNMSGRSLISSLLGRHLTPFEFFRLALVSSNDTGLDEPLFYGIPVHTELACKFILRNSAFIKLDDVVGITIKKYRGHVYDLQSDLYALYLCNEIIVSNCRCDGVLIVPKPKPVVEPKPIVDLSHLVGTSGMIAKADFVESEHPRADDGKWTAGAGGGGGKPAGDKPPKLKPQLEHGTMRVVQERQAERVKAMEAHYPGVKFSPQRYNKLALKEHPDLPGAGLPHAMFDNKATPVTDPAKTKAVVDACNKWGAKPGGYATYTTIKHETGLDYADVFGVVQALKAKDPYSVKMTVDRLGNNHAVAIDQKIAEPAESPKQAEAVHYTETEDYKIFSHQASKWLGASDYESRAIAYDIAKRNPELHEALLAEHFKGDVPKQTTLYRVGNLADDGITSFFTRKSSAESYQRRMGVDRITAYNVRTKSIVPSGAGSGEVWCNVEDLDEEIDPDLGKANWEETKHPRKKTGQFAPKGQGEASTSQDASGAQKPAKSLPVASGKAPKGGTN